MKKNGKTSRFYSAVIFMPARGMIGQNHPLSDFSQGYLRKLYGAGDDMSALAKGFDKEGQDKVYIPSDC